MNGMADQRFLDSGSSLRVPPHSIEAESSLLGGLLLDNTALDSVSGILAGADFYRHEHKLIFSAITTLVEGLKPADVVTVFEHLQSHGKADQVGGLPYLNSLAQFVPSGANLRRYAEIVRDKSVLRKLAGVGETISRSIQEPGAKSVEQLLDEAESQVLAIATNGGRAAEVNSIDALKARFIEQLQTRSENPCGVVGVSSGFDELDRYTNGLQAGDLIVIAGRPSMGKTALAINIAEHAAFKQQKAVLVVSIEMGADKLMIRMAGSIGSVDQSALHTGRLNDSEWGRVLEAMDAMTGNLEIEDGIDTVASIRAAARRFVKRNGKLGLIVVDYLQLMSSGDDKDENRNTEITQISRGLKLLANEMQCPVIVLSQLNRGVEQRPDKRPQMSDLRESGAIEQDADVIVFIYRDEYYTKQACKEPGVAEVIIAKQRNGPTGTLKLGWEPNYTRFHNLAA